MIFEKVLVLTYSLAPSMLMNVLLEYSNHKLKNVSISEVRVLYGEKIKYGEVS